LLEEAIREAIALGVDYVDLELDVAPNIKRYGKTKRIVSYHNLRKTPAELSDIYDPSRDFMFALSGDSSDALVGIDDAQAIVGTVMVGHDGHRGWLYYVASDPARRGLGIGRRMIAAAEGWLKDRGVRKVQLMVRESNEGVVNFYERLGYDVTPRVVMAKWIDGS